MITYEHIKTYILAKGWKFKANIGNAERYVIADSQGWYITLMPNSEDKNYEHYLHHSILAISQVEKLTYYVIVNKLLNTWLPFNFNNLPKTEDNFCVLLAKDNSWFECYSNLKKNAGGFVLVNSSFEELQNTKKRYKGWFYKIVTKL